MLRLVALVAILCGCLLLFGGTRSDRMSVRAISEPTLLTVVVTLNDITTEYRYLSVYGCSAEVGEFGTSCTGDFERESTFELTGGRKQHLIYWRNLPRGTMAITAMAFDVDHKLLAKGHLVVFRGR